MINKTDEVDTVELLVEILTKLRNLIVLLLCTMSFFSKWFISQLEPRT